jgi:hypothetical protein
MMQQTPTGRIKDVIEAYCSAQDKCWQIVQPHRRQSSARADLSLTLAQPRAFRFQHSHLPMHRLLQLRYPSADRSSLRSVGGQRTLGCPAVARARPGRVSKAIRRGCAKFFPEALAQGVELALGLLDRRGYVENLLELPVDFLTALGGGWIVSQHRMCCNHRGPERCRGCPPA